MLRDVYYGIPSTVYEGQLARGVFKGEVNGVVYYHLVHELETCSPGGTPGGITDASAGLCQYRQAEEGGGKASA